MADQAMAQLVTPAAPSGRGTRYVLACADNKHQVDEIAESNCVAAPGTVELSLQASSTQITGIDIGSAQQASPHGRIPMTLSVHVGATAKPARATVFLSRAPAVRADMRRLGAIDAPGGGDHTVAAKGRVRLPRKLAGDRRQFVVACMGARPQADRCLVAPRPLFVVR